ncbi:tetratricopeptide repeat-containing sensor histidine kinase [Moheibacter sediminis]|uniref:histidine kinase n=1 Tax=Moheibacter sediminis TaxID=1434700 RepID=A0A1W2AXC5_9FLAO|nr:tetratricopeptide repeat protein [Moheibacter sediminis]SMC65111.1 Tetratricopeptide repeat-containing protein [Moheibacter sediminis]
MSYTNIIICKIKLSKAIVFLFAGLILINVSCNQPEKDSSKSSSKINELNEKIFEELHKQTYEAPLATREKCFDLLKKISPKDLNSKIKLLKYIGSSYVFETNYPEAIKYYNKALNIAEETNNYNEIANLNNNLGMIFNEIGNFKTSYTYYFAALDNYDLAKNKDKKIGTLNNIGVIYLNLQNHEKALKFFEEALDSTVQHKDTILVASVLNNLAICYSEKNPQQALEELRNGIALSEKVNNQYGLCISYQIMGNIYLNSKEKQKAYDAYTKSIEIAEKANLSHQLSISKVGLGRVFLSMDKIDSALNIAHEVMHVAKEQNSLVLKSEAHHMLSDVYKANNEFEKSLINFQEHVKSQQELTNQTVVNQIYDVEFNHLSQLNKMQHLELEKKEMAISNKNSLLFFISLVFLLVLIGFYLAYRNHRHKQKVKLQTTVIELTKKKSKAALEAEIQERKRIGQELHDSLGYLLSLAGLNASVLHKRKDITEEKKNELLNSLMESIDDAFEEVRTISHNLAPSLLSEYGLKGALKNISDRINQSSRLKMTFDTFGLDAKIDDLIENVLYRTIQEIVNNTIKHAEATELFIQIAQDQNQITIMAEDNGKGFDIEEIKKQSSFGLYHIKSAVENLNGNLHIDSKINRGTIISIFIPLK